MITSKRMTAVTLLIAAAGCAPTDAVEETGPNSYSLSEIYSRGLFEGARDRAVSRAGEYCYQMDRRVIIEEVSHGPTNGHGAGLAKVTFRCPYRADPDLQRAK